MKRFQNQKTEQVFNTRFAPSIPSSVTVRAHEVMHPLLAAASLQDVAVLGTIWCWRGGSERLGIKINNKWFVTFDWADGIGAVELNLERR